jgi:hypothetical protein
MTKIARHTAACLLACFTAGHALGSDTEAPEGATLHAAAMRTLSSQYAPGEPPLRLYLDSSWGSRIGTPAGIGGPAPRIGLEFKLAPSPAHGLAKGQLLRTKLSENTHVSLRVRRHGVAVVLRSEF